METVATDGEVTVSVALWLTAAYPAEMTTFVGTLTAVVATVNVALLAPAGMVTLAGTVAIVVLLLASVTTLPPVGAAPVSVTVPWDVLPPITLVGFSVREESTGDGVGFVATVVT